MIVKVSSKFGVVIAKELQTVNIHAEANAEENISSIPEASAEETIQVSEVVQAAPVEACSNGLGNSDSEADPENIEGA